MKVARHVALLALVVSLTSVVPCFAQAQVASTPQAVLSPEAMEQFLVHGKIVATRNTRKGVTNARQITLSHEGFTHDAQAQDVDIALPIFQVDPKHTEINFKDTYRYNIAGYRLSLLMGLDNVPMSVERKFNGKPAAFTWWLDDVLMDEGDRQKKGTVGPDPLRTSSQLHLLRVFDELIQNRDRNAGNLAWTKDWKMWMIDHTRAFRLGKELLNPESLVRCERTLFQKMQELTASQVTDVMGKILTKQEVEALMARRDLIVRLFQDRIAQRGEETVLYTMPNGSN